MRFKSLFAAVLATALMALPASAAVLGFDSMGAAVVENGFVYDNTSAYNTGGQLYLHDDFGGQQKAGIASATGAYFDALTVDMAGYSRLYRTGAASRAAKASANWARSKSLKFANFTWNGYRDGNLVASTSGSALSKMWKTFVFDGAFSGLSSLELVFNGPKMAHVTDFFGGSGLGGKTAWCDQWCGGVQADNLRLRPGPSPVPLPAGMALLLGGFGVLTLAFGRRRARV